MTNPKIEANTGPTVQEGDVILKINNLPADNLNLKEAKKLIESSKEKLHLTVRREARSSPYSTYSTNSQPKGKQQLSVSIFRFYAWVITILFTYVAYCTLQRYTCSLGT